MAGEPMKQSMTTILNVIDALTKFYEYPVNFVEYVPASLGVTVWMVNYRLVESRLMNDGNAELSDFVAA